MKINDILNCINNILEEEREIKGLPKMLGHFVFHIGWKKGIGPIKEFHAYIDFINIKYGTTHHVVSYNTALSCPNDRLEEVKERVSLAAFEYFYRVLRLGAGKGAYENFVNGDFQGWN